MRRGDEAVEEELVSWRIMRRVAERLCAPCTDSERRDERETSGNR
jgi:hypothetical protein